jgi:hypothetical protein
MIEVIKMQTANPSGSVIDSWLMTSYQDLCVSTGLSERDE